jgi:hypothetical protein
MKPAVSRIRTISGPAALAVVILFATPSDAWAYIDPGTGSYLFQIAVAGLLGAAYTLRRYWHLVTSMLRGRSSGYDGTGPGKPRE